MKSHSHSETTNHTADLAEKYIYDPFDTLDVFAGVAPLNASLLKRTNVHISDVTSYFASWTYDIVRNPKFVIAVPPAECKDNACVSLFIPGSIESARVRDTTAKSTLLNGSYFQGTDIILVHNATGEQVEFSSLPGNFTFNMTQDCVLYSGQHGNAFFLCLAAINKNTIAAGGVSWLDSTYI